MRKEKSLTEIFNYYATKISTIMVTGVKEIISLFQAKKLLKEREHSIVALKEYAELIDVLGGEEEVAVQSVFLGFSAESIGADRATMYFYDNDSQSLFPNVTMVYKKRKLVPYDYYTELKDISIKIGKDVCGIAVKEKRPIFIESASNDKRYKGIVDKKIKMKINSIIAIPLLLDNNIFGVIEVANSIDNRYLTQIDFYVVSIIAQLTMTAMEKAKLYNWSITDNLTQLYNYHFLQVSLDKELTRAKRYSQNVGLLLLDIDNFKKINDTYGHLIGNTVLKGIASIIKNEIRQDIDLPVRYGGDEFLILLPETDLKGARAVAKRILKKVQEKKFKTGEKYISATVSIGVTTAKKNQVINKTKLIKKADDALYLAKQHGKNRIVSKA